MFAKEIFDYPELEEHPLLCNHLGKNDDNAKDAAADENDDDDS